MKCFRLRCYVNNSFLVFHQGTKHSKTIKHSRFALVFHTVFSCLDPLMKHSNSLFTYNIPNIPREIKHANCRYKLENNTLNSVLDCVSNKTEYQKDMLKGAEVIFGERYGLVMHCLHSSSLLYIVWYG